MYGIRAHLAYWVSYNCWLEIWNYNKFSCYLTLYSVQLQASNTEFYRQGLVVQSIVSLTSSLMDKMLTVLVSTVFNLNANAKATHIFSAKV